MRPFEVTLERSGRGDRFDLSKRHASDLCRSEEKPQFCGCSRARDGTPAGAYLCICFCLFGRCSHRPRYRRAF
ncbi:UNVERIFIED_CONTAM: hypothetical protein GTU68_018524 [Idotea baltica]|nr:hypothetical protein [Idotea baltica]